MLNRVLCYLRKEGNAVFTRVSTSFWTPHSARAFLPSCTKALGVPKEERYYLVVDGARAAAIRTRVSEVRVILNLQRLVIRALIERPNADPLAEEETILQFGTFMCEKGVGPEDRARCFQQLGKDSVSIPVARTPELAVEEVGPLNSSEVIPDTEQLAEMVQDEPRADKRLKSESSRTQVLGDDPTEVRDCARGLLDQDAACRLLDVARPGYYIAWETAT